MRPFLKALVVFLTTIGIAFCAIKEPTQAHSAMPDKIGVIAKPGELVILKKASVERDTNFSIAKSELPLVVAGNSAFAVDLYKKLTAENENTFFHPTVFLVRSQ